MSKPIYEKRQSLVSQIPNFWPLVLEQAPPDIDEFIQPLDSNLLLSALTSISVSRFELDENKAGGDPRSVAIRFEFSENDHFEDRVLEKKFWYRHADAGDFSGLVSEPVAINWKDGKDLTDGLLGLVKKVWDEDPNAFRVPSSEEQKEAAANKGKKEQKPLSAAQKALKEKMDATGLGGVSFFAWFGYVGRRVTAEESAAAAAEMREDMKARKEGKPAPNASAESKDEEDHEMGDDEDDEDDEDDFEIFPPGDELAQAIVMDLWPDALKYFSACFPFPFFSGSKTSLIPLDL